MLVLPVLRRGILSEIINIMPCETVVAFDFYSRPTTLLLYLVALSRLLALLGSINGFSTSITDHGEIIAQLISHPIHWTKSQYSLRTQLRPSCRDTAYVVLLFGRR